MLKNTGFEILISSDLQFNELCSEIYFEGQFVALITREKSFEKTILHIESPPTNEGWIFDYQDFIDTVQKAKKNLIRIDEPNTLTTKTDEINSENFLIKIDKQKSTSNIFDHDVICFSIYKKNGKYFIKIFKKELNHSLEFNVNEIIFILDKAKQFIDMS